MHREQSDDSNDPSGIPMRQKRSVLRQNHKAWYDAYEDEDGIVDFGNLWGEELSLGTRPKFLPAGYASERYTRAYKTRDLRGDEIPLGTIAVETTVDQHETVMDGQVTVLPSMAAEEDVHFGAMVLP